MIKIVKVNKSTGETFRRYNDFIDPDPFNDEELDRAYNLREELFKKIMKVANTMLRPKIETIYDEDNAIYKIVVTETAIIEDGIWKNVETLNEN